MIFAWIGMLLHPCLWFPSLILWIGLLLPWFLPKLCQSNETSFWFQQTCQDLDVQMNVAQAKIGWKLCICSSNAAMTLNILELVYENCFHSLNNVGFRKYLFSICHVHCTKILHRMFGLKKEQFLSLVSLQNRANMHILAKLSAVEKCISAIVKK